MDEAIRVWGGPADAWLDLSTGISPWSYPFGDVPAGSWQALPTQTAESGLVKAARRFWQVPDGADILAAPGASSVIARMPLLARQGRVQIEGPTYNEHAAAFGQAGWDVSAEGPGQAQVVVHPNNPDGRLWRSEELSGDLRIIDESFCDTMPEASLISEAGRSDTLVLKSFGKFWGLGGLRLGFVIGPARYIDALRSILGPWPVSGPAIMIGRQALSDPAWAAMHRDRLSESAVRLDQAFAAKGAQLLGGTSLFRLYEVDNAADWQARLARIRVWSRVFPYNARWIRLGLPGEDGWARLEGDW